MNVPFAFWTLTISGLTLISIVGWTMNKFNTFKKNGIKTFGLLLDYQTKKGDKSTTYHPIVEYQTLTGQKIKSTSPYGSSNANLSENTQVEIIYDVNNPEKFCLSDHNPTKTGYIIIAGVIFSYILLLLYFYKQDPNFLNKPFYF
jgi:hypothetical protein